ncbi:MULTISPECIES: apolipoprotein N-acyltransferase [unclassified Lysobacter]|uniref:apolipoprotein N-acyltransferase n=1 Tax=unclassified Lysobacter TaxID=2635362 RepID=UPI0006FC4F73|nr:MULTISPECIES: apolipoprotein N-acyltransferase [unclassified Lysobacter]KRC38076.1 apolipoprotein acyltransferase [Lysobacter sp. Root76]KRD69400.1 apolipoprotein acyltransferase [Lysobacter sp. Root96]
MTKERLSPSRWRSIAGILATAVLLGLYARGGPAWGLGFVALVPWLLVLATDRTMLRVSANAALMSIAFVAAAFHWFGAAIGAYTGVGASTGTVALLVSAPLLQPQFIAFALVRQWAGRRYGPVLRALAAACAWVACEWLAPKLLGDTLGHGLFSSAVLRQVADLGGAAGITLLLLLINEAVAFAMEQRGRGARTLLRPLALASVIVACMAGYGLVRRAALQAPPVDDAPTLRVAMVQASITDYERLRREMGAYAVVRHVLDTHYALSWSAIRDHDADVLLWSETVYPTSFGSPRSEDGAALDREIQGFVDAAGVPLVFGTYDRDGQGEYNAAAFLEPAKGMLGAYRKTHPFPLTEYVPAWLDGPWLRRWLPWAGGWRPGDGARVLPLRSADGREVNVVPLICLDDVHSDLAIDGARLGAQAIVGMSNDSWFTAYPVGARLHLAVAAFRSIETRLPQVRVTTNGLSAIIDDTGEVLASTSMGDQAVLTAFVSARDPSPTLMVRWGDWVGRAAAAFLLGLAALAAWQASRRRAKPVPEAESTVEVVVFTPFWRALAGALRLGAGAGLLWLAFDMLLRTGLQIQSLSQLGLFAAAVVAPLVAAWAIGRAFVAQARVEGPLLVLEQRRQRIEMPVASIAALRPWRVPLPRSGVDVRLAEGPRWTRCLALTRPNALQRMLAATGVPQRWEGGLARGLADLAQARADARRPRLDHALLKFALFPLLLALVAFRLHQVIAFGGSFGEYYSYGLRAYLSGLLIWWASWSIGLMLFAALLRVAIETVVVLAMALRSTHAAALRDALEWLGRLAFYVGVPAWLALRLLAAG